MGSPQVISLKQHAFCSRVGTIGRCILQGYDRPQDLSDQHQHHIMVPHHDAARAWTTCESSTMHGSCYSVLLCHGIETGWKFPCSEMCGIIRLRCRCVALLGKTAIVGETHCNAMQDGSGTIAVRGGLHQDCTVHKTMGMAAFANSSCAAEMCTSKAQIQVKISSPRPTGGIYMQPSQNLRSVCFCLHRS
jgi:hypothetical protein